MMNTQWMTTLNLALEIPFDSNEDVIWSKVLQKYSKFGDIFITTLSTIDIVRLPFIDYSLIKYYSNLKQNEMKTLEKAFSSLQNLFQLHIKQRTFAELLNLQKEDSQHFKVNIEKLYGKISELSQKQPNNKFLVNITLFVENLKSEIKELEEKKDDENEELES